MHETRSHAYQPTTACLPLHAYHLHDDLLPPHGRVLDSLLAQVLSHDANNVKALFRRGASHTKLGNLEQVEVS